MFLVKWRRCSNITSVLFFSQCFYELVLWPVLHTHTFTFVIVTYNNLYIWLNLFLYNCFFQIYLNNKPAYLVDSSARQNRADVKHEDLFIFWTLWKRKVLHLDTTGVFNNFMGNNLFLISDFSFSVHKNGAILYWYEKVARAKVTMTTLLQGTRVG